MERLNVSAFSRDPSVRKLAVIVTAGFVVALLGVIIIAYASMERVKADWVREQTSILGEMVRDRPELADEWARYAAKPSSISPEVALEGAKIAARYGLTPELESHLIPSVQAHERWLIVVGICFVFSLFTILSFVLLRTYHQNLSVTHRLALSVENTVKHNRPMAFRVYGDGEFGLLANNVQELAIRLRETIEQLQHDKTFLKDTIADISHQLKTPLASLQIYVELLKEGNTDTATTAEFLDTCGRELDRMEWLTLTLLKLARLEAGALDMHSENSDLRETVRQALSSVQGTADGRRVVLVADLPEQPAYCRHDPHWLGEAIRNVLGNAINHSPAGGRVTVRCIETPVFIRLTIADTGPGIEERHLPHIFKKFYRAGQGGHGVGLGLPLARTIAEKHGGLLSAGNSPGGGAVFTLTLPVHGGRPDFGSLTNL